MEFGLTGYAVQIVCTENLAWVTGTGAVWVHPSMDPRNNSELLRSSDTVLVTGAVPFQAAADSTSGGFFLMRTASDSGVL